MKKFEPGTIFLGTLGLVLFFVAWQLIGVYRLAGLTWPPLTAVVAVLADTNRWPLFGRALSATLTSTALGYFWGLVFGLGGAILAHLWPITRPGTDRLAAVINSIPSIALAPVFIVFLSRESTPAAIASVHAAFILYVSASSGLGAATRGHIDLLAVLGASPVQRLLRLGLPPPPPALFSGLQP